jgi:hypothetical protein
LKRKNFGNKYRSVISEMERGGSVYETFKWLHKNKKGIDYQPILDKMNGDEEDD